MSEKMHLFVVRNNPDFKYYIKRNWGYFLRKSRRLEDAKIVIRKDNVFIHISAHYTVICNDLNYLRSKGQVEANKKAFEWLDE